MTPADPTLASVADPRYPDLLNNPDGDPRIYQQQYEAWKDAQEKEPNRG